MFLICIRHRNYYIFDILEHQKITAIAISKKATTALEGWWKETIFFGGNVESFELMILCFTHCFIVEIASCNLKTLQEGFSKEFLLQNCNRIKFYMWLPCVGSKLETHALIHRGGFGLKLYTRCVSCKKCRDFKKSFIFCIIWILTRLPFRFWAVLKVETVKNCQETFRLHWYSPWQYFP